MKPTSIIFLIISVLLVIGGFTTMGVAKKLAAEEGVELVAEISEGSEDYIFQYEYADDNVGKIAVSVKNAKVNVYGGASKAYIELINFPDGMYDLNAGNHVLKISDITGLDSLDSLTALASNFKGLRSLVNFYNILGLERTVNIYLCDAIPVKVVECTSDNGDMTVKDCSATTDYNLKTGNGSLRLDNVSTMSAFQLETGTGDITLKNCYAGLLSIKIGSGRAELGATDFLTLNAELENGNLRLGYRYDFDYVNRDIDASGGVTIDGEALPNEVEDRTIPTSALCEISVKRGSVTIVSNEQDTDAES